MNLRFSKGFTLIELLIVISIIGILAAVVTISGSASRAQARDAERKANVGLVTAALEEYRAEHKRYPDIRNTQGSWAQLKNELFPKYIDRWPEDTVFNGASLGTGYVYASWCDNAQAGAYYAIDVPMESDERVTLDSDDIVETNNCDLKFFVSGQYESTSQNDRFHYRQSGR